MTATRFLKVAIPCPLYREFDYGIPSGIKSEQCQPGMRVEVSFGRRQLVGLILSLTNETSYDPSKIKPVLRLLDEEPLFNPQLMQLLVRASVYYHHPIGEVMMTALPKLLRNAQPAVMRGETLWSLREPLAAPLKAPKQQACLEALSQAANGLTQKQLLQEYGISAAVIKALSTKDLLQSRTALALPPLVPQDTSPVLNAEQHTAVTTVLKAFGHFESFLLEGITGSGKTEVYLQLIEQVLEGGKQALVLVPEISLTPQTIKRFAARFQVPIAAFHSGLNPTERLNAWVQAREGIAPIVIGTRSAIFTPLKSLGIIIIDEEHDASFKQQDNFRYSARDLALLRGKIESLPVILGSATPSFESLANVLQKRFTPLHLTTRAGNASEATFNTLDIRGQTLNAGLSPALLKIIDSHLTAGNQVLVFLNRRGYAPTLLCHQCGWVSHCPHCDAPLTLHLHSRRLHCHHCDFKKRLDTHCPKCQSENIMPRGQGTERLEHALQDLFPTTKIVRIDRDTTRNKGSLQNLLQRVEQGQAQLLIGTQMLAKGHHFPNVTLVAMLDVDAGLFSGDFRATERLGQLLLQVAGRAGRAEKPGEVVLQTHFPEHPHLRCLIEQGYGPFAKIILQERHAAALPPYTHHALLRADSENPTAAQSFLKQVRQTAETLCSEQVAILGPIPAPLAKRAGRVRAQLLIQSTSRRELHNLLAKLLPNIESTRVRWSCDIDPLDLN